MMQRKTLFCLLTMALACGMLPLSASADTLWDNGPLVTNPGAGAGGNDVSRHADLSQ